MMMVQLPCLNIGNNLLTVTGQFGQTLHIAIQGLKLILRLKSPDHP